MRTEDLGLLPARLAEAYGDKVTVKKVPNCKQPLSLIVIRKFSELLKIPATVLIKEYKLPEN
jgi:HTH-type transcriptional regulator/antitoxin HigA